MTFRPEAVTAFLDDFNKNKNKIRAFPGCHHLELLRNTDNPNLFFTFSIWENEEALQTYRRSGIFKNIWERTKKGFAAKPEAWSFFEF